MELKLTDAGSQFCVASSFAGSLVGVHEKAFQVQTGIGLLSMVMNPSTRVTRMGSEVVCEGITPVEHMLAAAREALGGHVMGRLVAYKDGHAPQERAFLLCTELVLQGPTGLEAVYMTPGFWVEQASALGAWWHDCARDHEYGGYFTNIGQCGELLDGPDAFDKWGYIVSRTVYALATAFSLTGNKDLLDSAKQGCAFLLDRATFRQSGHAFFHTRMDRQGRRHSDDVDVVNIFTQIYALTGLIAYYDVSRDSAVGQRIVDGVRALLSIFLDTEHGGFFDAVSHGTLRPIAGMTDSKSFNSIVDPLSATFFFLANSGLGARCPETDGLIDALCRLIIEHFVVPAERFIQEIFDRSWHPREPSWRNPYNTPYQAAEVGANLKTAWVLLRGMAETHVDSRGATLTHVRRILENLRATGAWDPLRGGWFARVERAGAFNAPGRHMWHTNKIWWQQEEGIVVHLLAYLSMGDQTYLETAQLGIRFWLTYFVDSVNGGVFDTVSIDGDPVVRQKGCWLKSGYHELELARYVYVYLNALQDGVVSLYSAYRPDVDFAAYRTIPARIPGAAWAVVDQRVVDDGVLRTQYRLRWVVRQLQRGGHEDR
jgi:mannose/cellobiose epimerase-like protein (N-acyl-D-glucosamine 2-epimerase family)